MQHNQTSSTRIPVSPALVMAALACLLCVLALAIAPCADAQELQVRTGQADILQNNGEAVRLKDETQLDTQALSNENWKSAKAALYSGIDKLQDTIDLESYNISTSRIKSLYSEVINSSPELFFVKPSYKYLYDGDQVISFYVQYAYSKSSIPGMRTKFEKALDEAVSWAPVDAKPADQAKAAHDWLVLNNSYCVKAAEMGYSSYTAEYNANPWNAYGALVAHKPVCQAYSLAYRAILNRLGIECTYVANHTDDGHSWNRVKIGSSWYHVDVTWDDPIPDTGWTKPSTKYFLKSDASIIAMSKEDDDDNYHGSWSPKGVAGTSTTYDKTTSWAMYSKPNVKSISGVASVSAISSYAYTGAAIKPAVSVYYNSRKLPTGSYSISYSNNTNAGTATVTVKGRGNCSGSTKATFQIRPAWASTTTVQSIATRTYTGSAFEPTPKVKFDGTTLVNGKDYTFTYKHNTKAGTAKCVVNGTGNFKGTHTVSFTIKQARIFKAKVGKIKAKRYTGQAITPKPTVKYKGKILKRNKDYTLSYKHNKKPGTAKVIITGKGNFKGKKVVTFTIK